MWLICCGTSIQWCIKHHTFRWQRFFVTIFTFVSFYISWLYFPTMTYELLADSFLASAPAFNCYQLSTVWYLDVLMMECPLQSQSGLVDCCLASQKDKCLSFALSQCTSSVDMYIPKCGQTTPKVDTKIHHIEVAKLLFEETVQKSVTKYLNLL